jgi:hypothetical protein
VVGAGPLPGRLSARPTRRIEPGGWKKSGSNPVLCLLLCAPLAPPSPGPFLLLHWKAQPTHRRKIPFSRVSPLAKGHLIVCLLDRCEEKIRRRIAPIAVKRWACAPSCSTACTTLPSVFFPSAAAGAGGQDVCHQCWAPGWRWPSPRSILCSGAIWIGKR